MRNRAATHAAVNSFVFFFCRAWLHCISDEDQQERLTRMLDRHLEQVIEVVTLMTTTTMIMILGSKMQYVDRVVVVAVVVKVVMMMFMMMVMLMMLMMLMMSTICV